MGVRNVVSDDEEEYEKDNARYALDTEAAEEEDGEDEEEEGQDEYEKDGFIVDDVEEEEEVREGRDEEMKARKKKKKREAEENYELDEDDYELLQEANVTGFHRPKAGSKKFKRLKKVIRNNDKEEKTSFSDDNEMEEGGRTSTTAEEKLKHSLFGDYEGVPQEDVVEKEDLLEEEYVGEEDEMEDFIVDDEEVDENGLPVRRRKLNKILPRQVRGISSSALQEAQDIFGAVDEILAHQKQGMKGKGFGEGLDDNLGAKGLLDEFEPSVLAEKYMTAKDDQIRETDVPERFQLSEEISGPYPHNEDTLPEAKWIYEQVFGSLAVLMRKEFQHIAKLDKKEVVKEIANVLQMCHDKKLEVPFVAMYRKEMCLNILRDKEDGSIEAANKESRGKLRTYKALWAIQHWDRKWLLLQRRKNALKASYEKRAGEEARRDLIKLKLLDSVLQSLDDAESERTVDDIDAKFNLHFPPDEVEVEGGQFKRPKRKSLYRICRKSGLGVVSRKFGLTSEQLGKNLSAMYKRHEVEDASAIPGDIATEFCVGEFGDPQSVLKGARHMAAVEISCEPAVKEYVRSIYMERAVVTTKPTTDGNNAIDSFHQYAGVKWLLNKPTNMFDNAQWLLIQKAEEEKLLQVTIGLPKDAIDKTLMPEFENQYLSDGVSRDAQLWNEQRKLILKDVLCNYILPSMEKEARMMLSVRAKSWLVQDYWMQLWKKVSVAPFQHQIDDNEERCQEDFETRVMACCQGSGKDPTTFVMLDPSGEVLDILFTSHLSIRSKNPGLLKRKENDQQRLSKFIMDHQPHIVVLGASNIRCKCLMDGICEVIFKMVEEHPCEMAEGLDSLNVVYADEVLPHLYENSRISRDQLPTQRGIVRRAVALGRYLQNPVAMVAALCGPGREILSLKLHSLEHFLSTDDRYEAVDQVMITVTNQVGVDINLAASHEWMFSPLQFVAGLGPRKAASIRRVILRAGHVFSRRELLTTLGAMQRLVFINAAGFLRVRRTGQAASGNHVMDPLDDTRIHPESYELAKKMAEEVYCEDVGKDIDDMDEEHQEMAIEHVKSHPHLLKALDIDEYARSVEQRLDNKKRETLDDIKIELLYGFQEWRPPYKQPSQDEEFLLLTGENEETLAEGKIVQVTVRRVLNQRVFCDLESGITGMIKKEELFDDRDIDPVEKITEGSILTCRVKNVQKAKCLVDLTCKPSELRVDHRQSRQDKDRYYAEDDCILQSEQEKACKEKELAKKSFKPRMIVHPRFQNISENDAIKNLLDKDAGESIIRPSSKGPFYLTITLKVFDGVYAHKDIVEGGKDHRDFASFLRLGKALSIGEETYKDLDEVIDRYVDPLVSNLKAILAYDKFKRGTKAEIDEALHKEKSESPEKIPCCISVSHEHPGAFLLSYVRSTNHHYEYFGIYPKGFRFRKRMFDNLDKLVAYFQKHMNDLVQDSIPLIRSVAAMVPMKSPDTGGSAGGGGSVGSGWGGSATNSVGGGDGGRQGHTGMNWGRSSTPGSRTGGNCYNANNPMVRPPSGLSRPPNGRDRGRQGRGGGSRGEGRGGGSRGGGCTEGRGGGSRGGGWSEGGDGCGRSGGWSDGGYCDSRDGRWGGGGGGCSRDSGWGGGGGDSSRDSGWGGGGGGGGGRDCGWGRGGGGRDGSWGRGESGGSRDGGWGGGGGSIVGGGGGGGSGGSGSMDGGWVSGGGGNSTDGGWVGGGGGGSTDGGWRGGSTDGDWGGRGDGGSTGGGWREGGGFSKGIGRGEGDGGIGDGGRSQGGGGWGEGGVGGSGDSGRSEGRGGWGEGGGGGSGDSGKSEGKGGWGGGGGGSSGDGGRSEGRRGGFGRGRSEGRGKGNRGRWSEDRGNRRGRSGGRGRSSGRGGLESNFTNGWGQNSGGNHISGSFSHKQESGAWGSKADGWGGNSVKRIPESPARGCWTASTGESGRNKQGNNGWDAIKVSEGWNSSRVSDIDAMSKDRTGGCDTVNKTGNSEMPGSSNGCDGWDDGNKVGSGSWDNNSMGGAGGWCQPTKSNDDRWNSVKIADRRSPNSFNGFGGKSNAGWGGTEVGKSNAGWGAEAGMPGDAWRGPQAANSNDAWGATEAARYNLEWGGTEEGKNDGWEMDGGKENDRWEMDGGKGNDGGANGWAIDSDGWSHLTAGGNVNAGGSGWGS